MTMASVTSVETLTWAEVGSNAYECTVGRRIGRVEPGTIETRDGDVPAWRASIRGVQHAPNELLELAWHTSRRDAFAWTGARLRPDLSADDLQHVIQNNGAK